MLHTMTAIRRANRDAGNHWFDSGTMRFFNTRVGKTCYPCKGGAFFVSSEKGSFGYRAYSVRFCSDDGEIDTIKKVSGVRNEPIGAS